MKLDRDQIERLLPHRPPFLLIDEVIDGEPGMRCVAVRTLRDDDFWFAGHFPGNPVMPGVLIVEALAQAATIAAASVALKGDGADAEPAAASAGDEPVAGSEPAGETSGAGMSGKIGLFAGIDKVRFKRVVKPGDTLRLEAEITTFRGPVGKAAVKATVDGDLACRGELMFAVVDASAIAAGEARL